MPYAPRQGEDKAYYENKSSDIKTVSDYTGLNFIEVWGLELFEYWGYLHDAVVWNCSLNDAGKDYLEEAYIFSQKEPDRDKLRAKLRGDKNGK